MRLRSLLLALALAAVAVGAAAQPTCIPGFYGTTLDVAAPKRSDTGWRVVWLCRDQAGQPKGEWLACVHGTCVEQTFRDSIYNATRATDPTAAIKAAWTTNVRGGCPSATGSLKVVCDEAAADSGRMVVAYLARQPTAPSNGTPAAVWVVSTNGTYATRPTYPFANGVRGTVAAAERVQVGAPCNPAIGVENYRAVLGRSDRVALCRAQ